MGTLRNTLLATLLVAGTGTAALAQTSDNGTAAQTPPPAATAPAAPAPVAPAPADNAVTANGTSGASSTADDRGGGGWGWIGLVGLVGLAGLMRRPDRVRVGSYDAAPSDTYAPGSRTAP